MICTYNKTGLEYRYLAVATFGDSDDPKLYVLYCPYNNEHSIFIMEEAEFYTKFTIAPPDQQI